MNTKNTTDDIANPDSENGNEYRRLIELGIALSAELDHDKLMESILLAAKEFCNADAGTLYLITDQNELCFQIIRNDSLDIAMGGTTGKPVDLPAVSILGSPFSPKIDTAS